MGILELQTASTFHLHTYSSLYSIMYITDGILSERVN